MSALILFLAIGTLLIGLGSLLGRRAGYICLIVGTLLGGVAGIVTVIEVMQ